MKQPSRIAFILAMAALAGGCMPQESAPLPIADMVEIDTTPMPELHAQISEVINNASPLPQWKGGLVGAMGSAHVKLLKDGKHELVTVLPQLTDTQIPVSYAITATPTDAATGFFLGRRDGTDTNDVVRVRLNGKRGQEVQISWSAVVLVVQPTTKPTPGDPSAYLQATSCAQCTAAPIKTLANQLWSTDGNSREFAIRVQDHIRGMQQRNQPRSMDAVGILESGGNWICTANANLASALFRAKGIPARSLAVIPPTGQRLEMHRILEYFDKSEWLRFDPSSIYTNVPMEYWQAIVMAATTPEDEALAMTPRMGASPGVPYGQELEFISGRMTFTGRDFFWTLARPLAGFEANDRMIMTGRQAWLHFLKTGRLSEGQTRAASATDAAGLLELLSVAP